jgi:hypothetical protein
MLPVKSRGDDGEIFEQRTVASDDGNAACRRDSVYDGAHAADRELRMMEL